MPKTGALGAEALRCSSGRPLGRGSQGPCAIDVSAASAERSPPPPPLAPPLCASAPVRARPIRDCLSSLGFSFGLSCHTHPECAPGLPIPHRCRLDVDPSRRFEVAGSAVTWKSPADGHSRHDVRRTWAKTARIKFKFPGSDLARPARLLQQRFPFRNWSR